MAVLGVNDERLRVHRALDIPALVIVAVERLKVDVARPRLDAGELGEGPEVGSAREGDAHDHRDPESGATGRSELAVRVE